MPYCCQCGNQVASSDRYCRTCGASQAAAGAPGNAPPQGFPQSDAHSFWNARNASRLCYFPWLGWVACVLVLATHRFQRDYEVRFHAFQGLYLFVACLMEDWVLRPMFLVAPDLHIHGIVEALLLGMSIFMMVKAAHEEAYPLPLFGELAHRSVAED